MPCSCQVPIDSYPENAEWGPLFWTLLHSLADRAGKQTVSMLQTDETRVWGKLLPSIGATLPCDICRNHYKEWLTENPFTIVSSIPYSSFGDWIRKLLWSLHNRINEGNKKPQFPFDSLSNYKNTDITKSWRALEPVIRKAINLNGLSLFPWKNFLGHVRGLQGIYE